VPLAEAGDQYVIPDKYKNLTVFSWGLCVRPAITKLYADCSANKGSTGSLGCRQWAPRAVVRSAAS